MRRTCYGRVRDRHISVEPLEMALNVPSEELDPFALVEGLERGSVIRHEIGMLPEHERVVTALFYLEGCSQQEIVAMLDIPLGAVKKRLQRARHTVIVVEHDEATVRAADHIIEMGPGPGAHAGGGSKEAAVVHGTVFEKLSPELAPAVKPDGSWVSCGGV